MISTYAMMDIAREASRHMQTPLIIDQEGDSELVRLVPASRATTT